MNGWVGAGHALRPASRKPFGSGAKTAIDVEHRAGHERGLRARQEHDAGGDLFRGAVTLQRVLTALGFGKVTAVLWIHVGVDRARLQTVHRNATGPGVARGALAVADDGVLGGGVVGEARERAAGSNPRADGDDAAAF